MTKPRLCINTTEMTSQQRVEALEPLNSETATDES